MPSIFQRLHRKSSRPSTAKTNGQQGEPPSGHVANGNGNGVSHRVSSSTMSSSQQGSTTPATSTTEDNTELPKHHGPTPLPVRSPTRAQRPSVDPLKRYSMNVRTRILFSQLY
jgi:hypothetical protein